MLLGKTQVINVLQGEVDGRDQQIKVSITEHKCRFPQLVCCDVLQNLQVCYGLLGEDLESQLFILRGADVFQTLFIIQNVQTGNRSI